MQLVTPPNTRLAALTRVGMFISPPGLSPHVSRALALLAEVRSPDFHRTRWVWIKPWPFWSSDEVPPGVSVSSDSYHYCLGKKMRVLGSDLIVWIAMTCSVIDFCIFKESLKWLFLERTTTTTSISVKSMVSGEDPVLLDRMHLEVKCGRPFLMRFWEENVEYGGAGEHSKHIALSIASMIHLCCPLSFMCTSSPVFPTGHSFPALCHLLQPWDSGS